MKIGVNLINFGPGATPEALEGWVRMTQDFGYHGLFTSDHVTITDDVAQRYPAPFYEPLSTLGWLAGRTTEIMIGTTVSVLPYRSPLETARAFAGIDQLSGGRCILGVGAGWAAEEFRILGVPFETRGKMTTEYLDAIKALWAGDVVSFDGEFVRFDRVHSTPRPLQQPHPPIWVGGNGAASMRRAIMQGTAWHPIRPTATGFAAEMLPAIRAMADRLGRDVPGLAPRIRLRVADSARPDTERIAGEGSLDQIRADIVVFEELGCEWIVLDTFHEYRVEELRDPQLAWRMFETFATEIYDLEAKTLR